jgi:hypothetical protein
MALMAKMPQSKLLSVSMWGIAFNIARPQK